MKRYSLSRGYSHWLMSGGAVLALLSSNSALAQGDNAVVATEQAAHSVDASSARDDNGDIVVTAQKREQTAMSTPLSISALGGEALAARRVVDISDLVRVSPGINIGQQWGVNRLFIRGIGLTTFAIGADPSSAFYVDGVYIGSPAAQLTSFYDIERVEVVRGPQGTLYGRNATGGAVNLISRAPTDDFSGYLDVTLGNYDQRDITGAVSGALSADGRLKARLAFNVLKRDGYGRNVFTGDDVDNLNSQAARLSLDYDASSSFSMNLIAEIFRQKDSAFFTSAFGAYPGNDLVGEQLGGLTIINSRDVASGIAGDTNRRNGHAITHVAKLDVDNGFSLQATSAYRYFKRHNAVDIDNTAYILPDGTGNGDGYTAETTRQFSEELQLAYKGDGLDVVAGLFYYHQWLKNDTFFPFSLFGPGLIYRELGTMKINAYAGYAQATYSVLPSVRLTGGVRYSIERRTTDGGFQGVGVPEVSVVGAKTWKSFTPKGGIEVDLAPNVLVYASVTKGFKSGTFNIGQDNPPINPEKVTSYEAGIKARLFDRRFDVSGAVFQYDYKDLQVNKIIGITTLTTNAAEAKIKGVEFSARARIGDFLMLDGDVTYLDPTFANFTSVNPLTPALPAEDLEGNQLPGATKWAVNMGAEIRAPIDAGEFTFRGGMSYRSRQYFNEFNNALTQPGHVKFDASVRFTSADDSWHISVWGKNLSNKRVAGVETLGVGGLGYPIYGSYEPPRTFGATFGVRF